MRIFCKKYYLDPSMPDCMANCTLKFYYTITKCSPLIIRFLNEVHLCKTSSEITCFACEFSAVRPVSKRVRNLFQVWGIGTVVYSNRVFCLRGSKINRVHVQRKVNQDMKLQGILSQGVLYKSEKYGEK